MIPKSFDLADFAARGAKGQICASEIKELVRTFGKLGLGLDPMGMDWSGETSQFQIVDFNQFRAYLLDNEEHHLGITETDVVELDPYICIQLAEKVHGSGP